MLRKWKLIQINGIVKTAQILTLLYSMAYTPQFLTLFLPTTRLCCIYHVEDDYFEDD